METGRYAGLDTGMNSLLCPALYGAHHEIVKLSRLGEAPSLTAGVVGPICETGDGPGHDRRLPPPSRAIHCSWRRRGHGASMSNEYNLRPPASETMLAAESA